jgi:hypothetical protein
MVPTQAGLGLLRKLLATAALWLVSLSGVAVAKDLPAPMRVWSVGPLTKSEPVMGISFGAKGATVAGPYTDYQTESVFAATRSVVLVADRVVLASRIGMRKIAGATVPADVYELLSLSVETGKVEDTREIDGFVALFATNDGHVIVAARSLMRLTPRLEDSGSFDYRTTGHRFGSVENISPDGSTLGETTSPGYELIDARTLKVMQLTSAPAVDTSVGDKGFVTDNIHWIGEFPKDLGFVTYVDAAGEHLLYHGKCGGRPQFLTSDLVLEPGCKNPLIINLRGEVVRTLTAKGRFSFAGVSQNGKRFALQTTHSAKRERFTVYSVATGERITEVAPDQVGEDQSWTAFSPDGSLFVIGSPSKLTLYRLP